MVSGRAWGCASALAPSRCTKTWIVESSTGQPTLAESFAAASYEPVTVAKQASLSSRAGLSCWGGLKNPSSPGSDSPSDRQPDFFRASRLGPPGRGRCAGPSALAAGGALCVRSGEKTPPGRVASAWCFTSSRRRFLSRPSFSTSCSIARSERRASVSDLFVFLSLFWFPLPREKPLTPLLWWWGQGTPAFHFKYRMLKQFCKRRMVFRRTNLLNCQSLNKEL